MHLAKVCRNMAENVEIQIGDSYFILFFFFYNNNNQEIIIGKPKTKRFGSSILCTSQLIFASRHLI